MMTSTTDITSSTLTTLLLAIGLTSPMSRRRAPHKSGYCDSDDNFFRRLESRHDAHVLVTDEQGPVLIFGFSVYKNLYPLFPFEPTWRSVSFSYLNYTPLGGSAVILCNKISHKEVSHHREPRLNISQHPKPAICYT